MIKIKNAFLFVVLLLTSVFLTAQEQRLENPQDWMGKISQQTKTVNSLYAKFEQQKILSFLESAVISEGEFWFSQPDKIRWEYKKPYHYTMIMNKGLLTVKDGADVFTSDMSSNQMFEQMNGLITGSIQGNLLSENKNYRKEYYHNEKHIILRLFPKDEQLLAYLDYMEIWFSKKNFNVEIMLMHEPSGDYTKMIFTDIKTNPNISPDVFE
ncbi:MAG: outer membrane lipoprotein carrier protein LolA [Bacteroidales bacterium]|nr:outer membrane lipoprotein carrier protein LolA [Bacteroidales bacterium]